MKQASIAATALAAALLRQLRSEVGSRVGTGKPGEEGRELEEVFADVPGVSIDSRDAALEFSSEKHIRESTAPPASRSIQLL